ncbi:hypothetical protein [Micromonospora haikouensis]|uniref:hypothetical protein n=1 Tax=Micromonospora haikouensis TaxID=686309 RepID=UPI003D7173DC
MNRSTRKRIAVLAAVGTLALAGLVGCAKMVEPFNDAPRSAVENTAPADIVTFPDGFSNVATKCDHGNRIYSAYHADSPYAAITVVPDDVTCTQ